MDTATQAQLALLKRLLDQGRLTEAEYQAEVAALESGAALPPKESPGTSAGSGAVVAGDISAPVATEGGIAAQGHVIIMGQGGRVIIGEPPVETPAVDPASALARYLRHLIAQNRYLALQGIRSGGKLVSIELEQIYVTLRATRERTVTAQEAWLAEEMRFAPGEFAGQRPAVAGHSQTETVTVSVNEALETYLHLVVLGDPGSGKTTLLRHLALLYARDLAEGDGLVNTRLGLAESGRLPVLVPLRKLAAYLKAHRPADDGTEGCALLLEHLRQLLAGDQVELPPHFFDPYLEAGNAVVLLDGLDEVADPDLRRRVARLVEAFTAAYPACRFIVTSRIVGYSGPARLGGDYASTTVRDFSDADIAQFLRNWHLAVAVGEMGPGPDAQARAAAQTQQLLNAIQANERVRELALNPLLLTVIALVHRDRVKLPDRRAELYAEAVDVLLGKWDEARGVQELAILPDQAFDAGDKRLLLQRLALTMHEAQQKEIAAEDLRRLLGDYFHGLVPDWRQVSSAVDRFLKVVEERTGLLAARGEGVYGFSHLTFQEYLAALAMAAQDDYVAYTLARCSDPWWREAILLEAGFLSIQSRERTTRLVRAIAECKKEPEPYHNLVLAAEMLRDVGSSRVEGELETEVQQRLRRELETPPPKGRLANMQVLLRRGLTAEQLARQRIAAAEALARIGGTKYWSVPYGEPEWVEIPAGNFWMGTESRRIAELQAWVNTQSFKDEDVRRFWLSTIKSEGPQHQVTLPKYRISKVPVTNAQYRLFVEATGHEIPKDWENGRPPKDKESHPVVYVSWHDAIAYCQWLSNVTSKPITLPSEAEWEKAARGDRDKREYPWGDKFEAPRCNSYALGLNSTTPVGIFPEGASPYGALDLSGNVWEWTRSLWGKDWREPEFRYPYTALEQRENLNAGDEVARVLRGGAFDNFERNVRCSYRNVLAPHGRLDDVGFRVVCGVLHTSDL